MEFGMLWRLVCLMNLILKGGNFTYVINNSNNKKTNKKQTNKTNQWKMKSSMLACIQPFFGLISFKLGMVVESSELYFLIAVWMTL